MPIERKLRINHTYRYLEAKRVDDTIQLLLFEYGDERLGKLDSRVTICLGQEDLDELRMFLDSEAEL